MSARMTIGSAFAYAVMFSGICAGAGPAIAKDGPPADARIAHQVAAIDAMLPKMEKQDRLLSGLSAEGASVDAYRSGGDVKKITVETLNESGRIIAHYYFEHGSLLRVRVQDFKYKTGSNGNPLPVKTSGHPAAGPAGKVTADETYDFADDRLVRHIGTHGKTTSPDVDATTQQANLLTHAKSFVLLVNTAGSDGSGAWECAHGEADNCMEYKLEDAPAPH